jgi:hypothetical protein
MVRNEPSSFQRRHARPVLRLGDRRRRWLVLVLVLMAPLLQALFASLQGARALDVD